jgi:hypothetical protein
VNTFFHKVYIADITQNIQNYFPQHQYTHLKKMYLYHCLPHHMVSHVVCTGHPYLETWLPKFVCLGAHVKSGIPARSSNMRFIYPLHFRYFSPSEENSERTVCTKFTNMPGYILGLWLVSMNIYCKLTTNSVWGTCSLIYFILW